MDGLAFQGSSPLDSRFRGNDGTGRGNDGDGRVNDGGGDPGSRHSRESGSSRQRRRETLPSDMRRRCAYPVIPAQAGIPAKPWAPALRLPRHSRASGKPCRATCAGAAPTPSFPRKRESLPSHVRRRCACPVIPAQAGIPAEPRAPALRLPRHSRASGKPCRATCAGAAPAPSFPRKRETLPSHVRRRCACPVIPAQAGNPAERHALALRLPRHSRASGNPSRPMSFAAKAKVRPA